MHMRCIPGAPCCLDLVVKREKRVTVVTKTVNRECMLMVASGELSDGPREDEGSVRVPASREGK